MNTVLWRVFPYDATAPSRAPFAADSTPSGQGAGRFDIPDLTPVWYFAESPEHAVAEVIQGLRNQTLEGPDLTRYGMPLALVDARLRADNAKLPDLCDPAMLHAYGVRPDDLASTDFTRTRSIARALFEAGCAGFRWWSALAGDWHSTIIFDASLNAARERADLVFGVPEPLELTSSAVMGAVRRLSISVATS